MNTLKREGSLFGGARYCGTDEVSAAYHHVHMRPDATTHLGIKWHGQDYLFFVLPFGQKIGLTTAAHRVFTTVMGHTVRFLRCVGIRVLPCLDDLIFAAITAREALIRFIYPTNCVGCHEPTARFVALAPGCPGGPAAQAFFVPADKCLLRLARDTTPRAVARLKGPITSSWVAAINTTRAGTREKDRVIGQRPSAHSSSATSSDSGPFG